MKIQNILVMVSQYIIKENFNQIAHEQAWVCSTRKWAKLEHKFCLWWVRAWVVFEKNLNKQVWIFNTWVSSFIALVIVPTIQIYKSLHKLMRVIFRVECLKFKLML